MKDGWKVNVTKLDYDSFIFPAVISVSPANIQEMEIAKRAFDVLRNERFARPEDIAPEDIRAAALEGKFLAPSWQLKESEADFDFVNKDVASYVARCLRAYRLGRLNLVAGQYVADLADRIEGNGD